MVPSGGFINDEKFSGQRTCFSPRHKYVAVTLTSYRFCTYETVQMKVKNDDRYCGVTAHR